MEFHSQVVPVSFPRLAGEKNALQVQKRKKKQQTLKPVFSILFADRDSFRRLLDNFFFGMLALFQHRESAVLVLAKARANRSP